MLRIKRSCVRVLYCNDKAGVEDKKDDNHEWLLRGLKLTPEQFEKVKEDDALLNALKENLEKKRRANAEAKESREKLEKLEAEKRKAEEEVLAKKGEYEKLYKQTAEELEKTKQLQKDLIIKKELELFAIENGIKKREYLKLFDYSKLGIDDNLNVVGVEENFKIFKEDNPELFNSDKKITPDASKPTGGNVGSDEIEKLKIQAEKTRAPRDIAAYMRAVKERDSK
jgi:flagellar biosynthesis GTPase FlhF